MDFLCAWWWLYTTDSEVKKATIYLGWNFTQKADWDVGQDLRQPRSDILWPRALLVACGLYVLKISLIETLDKI